MRRPKLFGTLAGLTVVLAVAAWQRRDGHPTYDRIRIGMSREEVYSVLGGGPTGFTTGSASSLVEQDPRPNRNWNAANDSVVDIWFPDEGEIHLAFDDHERVKWRGWAPSEQMKAASFQGLLGRCNRLWRKWVFGEEDVPMPVIDGVLPAVPPSTTE
jgi:hypothetical protein